MPVIVHQLETANRRHTTESASAGSPTASSPSCPAKPSSMRESPTLTVPPHGPRVTRRILVLILILAFSIVAIYMVATRRWLSFR